MASQELRAASANTREYCQTLLSGPLPSLDEMRRTSAESLTRLPDVPGTSISDVDAGGVPCEWTDLSDQPEPGGTILYFHGGGFVQGSPATHRRIVGSLCVAANA